MVTLAINAGRVVRMLLGADVFSLPSFFVLTGQKGDLHPTLTPKPASCASYLKVRRVHLAAFI